MLTAIDLSIKFGMEKAEFFENLIKLIGVYISYTTSSRLQVSKTEPINTYYLEYFNFGV